LSVGWSAGDARGRTAPVNKQKKAAKKQEKSLKADELSLKGRSKSYKCTEKAHVNIIESEAF
jgi:hypothetical protein